MQAFQRLQQCVALTVLSCWCMVENKQRRKRMAVSFSLSPLFVILYFTAFVVAAGAHTASLPVLPLPRWSLCVVRCSYSGFWTPRFL